MATKKSSKASQGNQGGQYTKKGAGKNGGGQALAPTQDPIIITGGSVFLEFAKRGTDGLDDDDATNSNPHSPANPNRKKFKHKGNGVGNVRLSRIDIFVPPQKTNTIPAATPQLSIDIAALGIDPKKCQIWIYYDK